MNVFLSILYSITLQLGPNYDPLFYDVMVYIFGTVMFAAVIIGVTIVMIKKRKKPLRKKTRGKIQ